MAAAATSPVSASAAKEVEVEAEAEAAKKELGAEAPITGRATNQARARSGPRRAAQPQRRAPSASGETFGVVAAETLRAGETNLRQKHLVGPPGRMVSNAGPQQKISK